MWIRYPISPIVSPGPGSACTACGPHAGDDQQLPDRQQDADGENPRPDGAEDALEPIPFHCSFAPARKPRRDLVRKA